MTNLNRLRLPDRDRPFQCDFVPRSVLARSAG
jgi:hypothetical protein